MFFLKKKQKTGKTCFRAPQRRGPSEEQKQVLSLSPITFLASLQWDGTLAHPHQSTTRGKETSLKKTN